MVRTLAQRVGRPAVQIKLTRDADSGGTLRGWEKLDRSPAPDFHARRKKVRQAMRDAYAWVVAEYREAADRLRAGDRHARFPEGTFPPGLPFVPFPRPP